MSAGASLTGVFAALPTPFDDGGRIDQKALDHLVDYLASRELAGVALLTEAAEDPLLGPDERRVLISSILGRLKGKKPALVGISAPATREAVELAKHAHAKGATGILIAPYRLPAYGYRELYRHLERLSKSVDLPILLSVRPENAIDALSPEEVATLARHSGLAGVFCGDPSAASIEAWARRIKKREDAAVLSSSSLAFSAAAKAGASGSICGIAVIAAEQSVRLFAAISRGEHEAAGVMEKRLAPAAELLGPQRGPDDLDGVGRLAAKLARRSLDGTNLAPTVPFALIKEALRLQGHPIKNRVRPPCEPVSADASERLKAALRVSGLMT